MTHAVPDILARIVSHKAQELREAAVPREQLEKAAAERISDRRDFAAALRSKRPAIIAEIKKASPSKGLLAPNFAPAETAVAYEHGGAAALSVLTDRSFFQGSLADLDSARRATCLPALRKDFTTDPYHVLEAAAHGADAILLIAAVLDERQMRDLRELAGQFGLACLVEVHDREELRVALGSGAEIVGVNNRDLRTFEVKLETSLELAPHIPAAVIKVSESGIENSRQIEELSAAGFDAFLVGEHLMRSPDPEAALRLLLP